MISSKRESIPPIKQREDTDLSQDVRKVKESTPSRLNATNRISKLNEPTQREEYGQMEDGVLTRSVSQPKLSKRFFLLGRFPDNEGYFSVGHHRQHRFHLLESRINGLRCRG